MYVVRSGVNEPAIVQELLTDQGYLIEQMSHLDRAQTYADPRSDRVERRLVVWVVFGEGLARMGEEHASLVGGDLVIFEPDDQAWVFEATGSSVGFIVATTEPTGDIPQFI